jgi:hypothetical protein
MTPKQSLLRRCLTVLSAALLATVWAVGISIPASAAPVKGSLEIVSVTSTDAKLCPSPDKCVIVENPNQNQNQLFAVKVRVLDNDKNPTTVSKATTIVFEKDPSDNSVGSLLPQSQADREVTIPRNGSEATFTGLAYTQSANPTFRVRVTSGVELESDSIRVHVAITAKGDFSRGKGDALDVVDQNCVLPTSTQPTCGHWLLPNGAEGSVVMAVGSCDGIGPAQSPSCRAGDGGVHALVVTALGNLGVLYTPDAPATMILVCDKVICGGTGVPKLPVFYNFDNAANLLTESAPACLAKGVVTGDKGICVDYVQSTRDKGDLFLYVLFDHDLRMGS